MKLKDIVKIRMDDNSMLEVAGEKFPYTYDKAEFNLIIHESVQPWTPNVLDISEESTGCRCTSTHKPVSSSTKSDIITAMNLFIADKGLKNFQQQIKVKRRI